MSSLMACDQGTALEGLVYGGVNESSRAVARGQGLDYTGLLNLYCHYLTKA